MPIGEPLGFRMTTGNLWLLRQALRLFRNALRYWKDDVEDDDFFVLFRDPSLSSVREAKTMLKRHFTLDELARGGHVEVLRANGDNGERTACISPGSTGIPTVTTITGSASTSIMRSRRMVFSMRSKGR